jgi:hypothetical protein
VIQKQISSRLPFPGTKNTPTHDCLFKGQTSTFVKNQKNAKKDSIQVAVFKYSKIKKANYER